MPIIARKRLVAGDSPAAATNAAHTSQPNRYADLVVRERVRRVNPPAATPISAATASVAASGSTLKPQAEATIPAASEQTPCASSANDNSRDYDVGRYKPPLHTRFKPGQSGNPKGRPKGAKGLKTIAREECSQKVIVRSARGSEKIPALQALFRKTMEAAFNGDLRAAAIILREARDAIPDESHQVTSATVMTKQDVDESDQAILDALKALLLEQADPE